MTRNDLALALAVLPLLGAQPREAAATEGEMTSGHFTTSDGVTLHYLEAGSGPSLVLVPGWTMPAEVWEPQLKHFARTHHVVALDPRGQGRSQKATDGYYPSRRAADIGELLEHLDAGPAVVAGWSLGMQEVLVYTLENGTDRVRGVVLVDQPIHADWGYLGERLAALQQDRRGWTRYFIEAIHRRPHPEEHLEAMTRAALSMPTTAAALLIANLIVLGPGDLRPALRALDRPVSYIVVEGRDEQVALVRELRPDAHVAVLENVGHALFVDAPEEFNDALEEFLATLPE